MPIVEFEDWEAKQLKNPEFQAAAREQEPPYQVSRLRILRGLTQGQLAKRIGTQQPSIARLESGKRDPDIPFVPLEPRLRKAKTKSQRNA